MRFFEKYEYFSLFFEENRKFLPKGVENIYGHETPKIEFCLKNWPINMCIDPISLQLVGLFYNYQSSLIFSKFEKSSNFEYLYLKNYYT